MSTGILCIFYGHTSEPVTYFGKHPEVHEVTHRLDRTPDSARRVHNFFQFNWKAYICKHFSVLFALHLTNNGASLERLDPGLSK